MAKGRKAPIGSKARRQYVQSQLNKYQTKELKRKHRALKKELYKNPKRNARPKRKFDGVMYDCVNRKGFRKKATAQKIADEFGILFNHRIVKAPKRMGNKWLLYSHMKR